MQGEVERNSEWFEMLRKAFTRHFTVLVAQENAFRRSHLACFDSINGIIITIAANVPFRKP